MSFWQGAMYACLKITRNSLVCVHQSPWRKVLQLRVEESFITLLGFDIKYFFYRCKKTSQIFDDYFPFTKDKLFTNKESNKGRKITVKLEDCTELVLVWIYTRGSQYALQLILGMITTHLNKYL